MDKLQYDSLYKFLVSLGIVLIVLPVAAAIYLLNREPILISQADFDLLSELSLRMVRGQSAFSAELMAALPWMAGASILMGLGLLFCGIFKWIGIQRNLDKKLDAETAIQALNLLEMNHKEIDQKIEREASEAAADSQGAAQGSSDLASRYREIETRCFEYFVKKYARRYTFKRNIRIGRYEYDFIGVSQSDNRDMLVETKYFQTAAGISRRLYDAFEHFYQAGVSYETIAHRNFSCVVVVVTPKTQLARLETIVETFCAAHRESAARISIKCIAEEAL